MTMILAICCCSTDSLFSQIGNEVPASWLDDADLTDLFFLDARNGWVSGDHGLLLQTKDGGATWEQIQTGVSCRLESVWFADKETGWAVGGYHQPHSDRSVAVVLKTVNGGKTWIKNRQLALPKLYQVQFMDRHSGWAIGDGSLTFPSGVFFTSDGGRNWSSHQSEQIKDWRSGIPVGRSLLLVDSGGVVQRVTSSGNQRVDSIRHTQARFRAIGMGTNELMWAAGSDGWIARSTDTGRDWQFSNREIEGRLKAFDLNSVFAVGDSCWIAGRPGSQVIRTRDRGQSWSVHATGQSLPIKLLKFVDEKHGWAIGSLGMILHSSDGGNSWQAQRGGNRRATMLGFFHDAQSIPFELFSFVSAGESRYSAALHVRSNLNNSSGNSVKTQRLREALARVGCSSVEEFSLDQTADSESIQRRLVALIRAWRPSTIAIQKVAATDRFATNFQGHLRMAIRLAADQDAFPEQLQNGAMTTWHVSKILQVGDQLAWSDNALDPARYLAGIGRTAEDHSMVSRQIVSSKFELPPEKFAITISDAEMSGRFSTENLLSGLPDIVGETSRAKQETVSGNLNSMRFLTRKEERLAELIKLPFNRPSEQRHWHAQIFELTNGLPMETSGNTLFQLASQYNRAGRSVLAAKTLRLFVNNHIDHPLIDPALTWLLQYHGSGEIRYGDHPELIATDDRAMESSENIVTAGYFEPIEADLGETEDDPSSIDPRLQQPAVRQASFHAESTQPFDESEMDHIGQTERISNAIHQVRATLFQQPEIQMPLAAIHRNLPGSEGKKHSLQMLKEYSVVGQSWKSRAQAELWLSNQLTTQPPLPVVQVASVPKPPRLDGKLDEEFWRTIAMSPLVIRIEGESGACPKSEIMFAHDDRFIYIAAKCEKQPNYRYVSDPRARPRDAKLSGNDRLKIEIDTDRDFVSFYELEIDARGWVNESRFGSPAWDPEWFVASGSGDTHWTIEAAIPISELAGKIPSDSEAWAIRIARILPEDETILKSWQTVGVATDSSACGLMQFDR